ncbi:hypothetical protein SAMN05216330_12028 [Bradyrhizobium sp. Ghvi]|nr:hypothetical protein SAMN05216330_12028 [Bradyrhizobium sp. Ghvi]
MQPDLRYRRIYLISKALGRILYRRRRDCAAVHVRDQIDCLEEKLNVLGMTGPRRTILMAASRSDKSIWCHY